MNDPWVPPYFGSYQHLLHELLNNPGLGGGFVPAPHPHNAMLSANPQPSPWRAALSLLISEISLKDVASRLPDGKTKNELLTAADESLSAAVDEYCGTPPHPSPMILVLAAELAAFGESLPEGGLRNQLYSLAGQLVQRSFVAPARAAAAGSSG